MKRIILAMYFGGLLFGAEAPAPNAQARLEPYHARALANALRGLNTQTSHELPGYLERRDPKSEPLALLMANSNAESSDVGCAIPLVEAHANRALDNKVQRQIKGDSSLSDRMPKLKGLPVCRDNKE